MSWREPRAQHWLNTSAGESASRARRSARVKMMCVVSSAWEVCGSGMGDQCAGLWAALIELEQKRLKVKGMWTGLAKREKRELD